MLFKLPSADVETPNVRWRRGLIVDVDPQFAKKLKHAGAVEVSAEEAAAANTEVDPEPKTKGKGKSDG